MEMDVRVTRAIGRTGAVVAFTLCLAAGVHILRLVNFSDTKDGGIFTGLGLYFVGKAFFVGPMLWVATEQYTRAAKENKN